MNQVLDGTSSVERADLDISTFRAPSRKKLLWLVAILLAVFLFSVFLGRYPQVGLLSPGQITSDPIAERLVLNLRLPRILAAVLIGMSLAAAGLVFQMIFANPLVEPGLLGVSQASAFGASVAIVFFGGLAWLVQASAVIFGIVGLALSYLMARRLRYGGWVLRLLLSGIAISAFFSAGVGLLKYLADPLRQLPEITFWLLGGLWATGWAQLLSVIPLILTGLLCIFLMRWRLNILALEDDVSYALGVSASRERLGILLAAVAVTAASISISGLIGWAGLIVPHLARRLFGADARSSIPATLLLGAIFMVICDDLGRTLLAGEIPLGILTSLIGAVAFLMLMTRPMFRVEK